MIKEETKDVKPQFNVSLIYQQRLWSSEDLTFAFINNILSKVSKYLLIIPDIIPLMFVQ